MLWYEYQGMGPDEIAAQYDLTLTQVFAALAFCHANLDTLQAHWNEEEEWLEQLKGSIPSKICKWEIDR